MRFSYHFAPGDQAASKYPIIVITIKPVYNDCPRDPKCVAVVDMWSLFKGI